MASPVFAVAAHRPVVPNVRVSHDHYLAHSEPDVAENPTNHQNLIAGSKMFTSPAQYVFKIGTYYTMDGGKTWHDSGFLPGFGAYKLVSDVSIAFGPDGTAYVCVLAWDGQNTSGIFVSRSTDGGKTFSAPALVYLDTTGTVFNDKPWITVDNTTGPSRGNVYVAWNMDGSNARDPDGLHPDQAAAGSGIAFSRSTDGGRTFSAPTIVALFDQQHFYIGALPAVAPDGTIYIPFSSMDGSGKVDGIAMVSSSDGGQTFKPVRTIIKDLVPIPNHLPHSTFRNITLPAFAISPRDGTMIIAWSDYRYGDADIMASRSTDAGKTWSKPVRVNHDPIGDRKDQFEPALAVAPDGVFTCAWFDRRWDRNDRLIDEAVAQSSNDGRSFGHVLRVTRHSWNPAIDAPRPDGKATNTFIGDYQGLAADNQVVHPLWNDTQNGKSQQIRTAIVGITLLRR